MALQLEFTFERLICVLSFKITSGNNVNFEPLSLVHLDHFSGWHRRVVCEHFYCFFFKVII